MKPDAACVDAQEDEEEEGEAPEGGTAIAEKGQGDADDGHEAQDHADVDDDMEEEDGEDAVAVDATEGGGLSFGHMDDAQQKGQEEEEDGS